MPGSYRTARSAEGACKFEGPAIKFDGEQLCTKDVECVQSYPASGVDEDRKRLAELRRQENNFAAVAGIPTD
jgi:hypothetical protein